MKNELIENMLEFIFYISGFTLPVFIVLILWKNGGWYNYFSTIFSCIAIYLGMYINLKKRFD